MLVVSCALLAASGGAGLAAQESALLPQAEAQKVFTRAQQLVESTAITVPGLARAAAPVAENIRQALANLEASPRHSGQTYNFAANLKAYLALADSLPKPYPFPAAASQQFAELRDAVVRIESHFRALLDGKEAQLVNPDRDNLTRYAEANRLLSPPERNTQRVVFLGDSITDGWRLNEYFPERDFVNRGISGQITGEMLGRMQADVIDLKPAAMLLLAGTNDLSRGVPLTTIQNNLTMIVGLAQANNIAVVLASVLPIHDYNQDVDALFRRSDRRPPAKILELNDWIRRFAGEKNAVYLDYFADMVDANGFLQKELADDGLHPNANGYRIMAPLAHTAIESALRGRREERPQQRRRFPF